MSEELKSLSTQLAENKEKIKSLEDCLSLLKTSNTLSKTENGGAMSLFFTYIFKMSAIKLAGLGLLGTPLALFAGRNLYSFVMLRYSLIEVKKTLSDIADGQEVTYDSVKALAKSSSTMVASFKNNDNLMAEAIGKNRAAIMELKTNLALLTSSHKSLSKDVRSQTESIENLNHSVRQILDKPANLADTASSRMMDILD